MKLTHANCYRMTGICRGVLNQENGLSEYNIRRFLNRFPQVNAAWLLTGFGTMELLPVEATEKAEPFGVTNAMKSIPLVPAHYLASYFSKGGLPTLSSVGRFDMPILSGADFFFQMQGTGLSLVCNSGDFLICRVVREEKVMMWNSVFVLDTCFGPIVKRLRRGSTEESFNLISDDEGYESIEIERSDVNHFAVVIGVLRIC